MRTGGASDTHLLPKTNYTFSEIITDAERLKGNSFKLGDIELKFSRVKNVEGTNYLVFDKGDVKESGRLLYVTFVPNEGKPTSRELFGNFTKISQGGKKRSKKTSKRINKKIVPIDKITKYRL